MPVLHLMVVIYFASPSELHLHSIDSATHPTATCNDGTTQGYYISTGEAELDDRWVVHLQGGGWCWDGASCRSREENTPELTSNSSWTPTQHRSGVFDDDAAKNPLSSHRKVYIPYCTSDGWMGNREASITTGNWSFRGQSAIRSTLSTLSLQHGLGQVAGTKVVFSGCSAGGRGAMVTLDYLNEFFGENVTLDFGLLDSALYVDLEPIDHGVVSLAEQTQNVYIYANASGRVEGSACGKVYTGSDAWKCLFGAYRMPLITPPFTPNAAQFDSYQLSVDVGSVNVTSYTPQQTAYALEVFQPKTRATLPTLPSYFSSSCLHHCVTEEHWFWDIEVANMSLATVVGKMLEGERGVKVEGTCTESIGCGAGCNPNTEPW